jgi:hypothetical protein
MILEETEGQVVVTLEGKQVTVGTYFEDSMYPAVSVIGAGKAIFRVDSSSTVERKGLMLGTRTENTPVVAPRTPPTPATAPVEAAPVAERVTPPVETPSQAAKET